MALNWICTFLIKQVFLFTLYTHKLKMSLYSPIFSNHTMKTISKCHLSIILFGLTTGCFAQGNIQLNPMLASNIDQPVLSSICAQLQVPCYRAEAQLWQQSSDDQIYYLIDQTPQLVKLRIKDSSYQVLDQWSFKNFQHSDQACEDESDTCSLVIYPAIYPLNQQEQAIAILSHGFSMYSGGGRSEKIADFVRLDSQGKYKTALTHIPFHRSEKIRACFTEQQYATSPHCQDEYWTELKIQFKDLKQTYYQWEFNYSDFTWEAFQPEKDQTIVHHEKVLKMPFEQPR